MWHRKLELTPSREPITEQTTKRGSTRGKSGCCSKRACILILAFISAVLFGLAVVASIYWRTLFEAEIIKQTRLTEGSETYKNWQSPPVPTYMNFYVFSYLNADEVARGAKPKVFEKGPYAYREVRVNEVLRQTVEEITYVQNYSYVWDAEKSCSECSETDMIVTPNIGVLSVLEAMKHKSSLLKIGLDFAVGLLGGSLFHTRSVRELLWGYHDPFLIKLKKYTSGLSMARDMPPINPFIQLKYNGSEAAEETGSITIDTGTKDIKNVQKILKWRGLNNSPHWNNNYSTMLNGTDGSHFAPFMDKNKTHDIFSTDIGRSLHIQFDSDTRIHGIALDRYTSVMHMGQGFCVPNLRCHEQGLLYIGHLKSGNPPILVSGPHFYQTVELWKSIDGLSPPEKTKHATFLSFEPITGILMEAHKRMQVNVLVEDLGFSLSGRIINGKVHLPVMYIHQTATIDAATAEMFRKKVYNGRAMLKNAKYVLYAASTLVMFAVIATAILRTNQSTVAHPSKHMVPASFTSDQHGNLSAIDSQDSVNNHQHPTTNNDQHGSLAVESQAASANYQRRNLPNLPSVQYAVPVPAVRTDREDPVHIVTHHVNEGYDQPF